MKLIFLFILLSVLFGCKPRHKELNTELQKVITHYSQSPSDSLKLRAAWFLIENMDAHYTQDSKELRAYYTFIDSVFRKETYFFRIDSIYKDYLAKHPTLNLNLYKDRDYIKADYLMKNIDQAFLHWQSHWTKHLSFVQFCEFILPYRIDDEILEPWRKIFIDKYKNTFTKAEYDTLSLEQACNRLNTELKKQKIQVHYNSIYISGIKPTTIINMKFGICKDYNNLGIYVMRSMGIPVAIDKTPYGHSWNVLIRGTGAVAFSAAEHNLGEHLQYWKQLGKVYRQTYSINMQSLIFTCGDEKIPHEFRNPCYLDVTKEYFKGVDVDVNIKGNTQNKKYLYLCVFSRNFRFADWAKINNDKAMFENMGDSSIYFPVYYTQWGVEHAAYPLIIRKKSKIFEVLKPDSGNLQNMVLYRKHPYKGKQILYLTKSIGGVFQGANNPNFSDAKTLCRIDKRPKMRMNAVNCNVNKSRYVRYSSPDSSYCNIAEIEFYEHSNPTPLKGRVIGTKGCNELSPRCTKDKVFDGDLLTYFHAPKPNGAWIGLDLGTKKQIETIKYITRNDDNGVREGQIYELLYMGLKGWCSMGTQTAKADSLIYTKVPRNAVYLLKNLTKGKEEQIFTYERGKQVWW